MAAKLTGKRVALLVMDGFEQIELTSPQAALDDAGAMTCLVSTKEDVVHGWQHTKWGDEFKVDVTIDDARPDDFDALVLPGGRDEPGQIAPRQPRTALRAQLRR